MVAVATEREERGLRLVGVQASANRDKSALLRPRARLVFEIVQRPATVERMEAQAAESCAQRARQARDDRVLGAMVLELRQCHVTVEGMIAADPHFAN